MKAFEWVSAASVPEAVKRLQSEKPVANRD